MSIKTAELNKKLWKMAKVITDKQKSAKEEPTDKIDWNMLEEEWFDWLQEELSTSQFQQPTDDVEIKSFEEFYHQTGEDYVLWDEREQGIYPIQRIFDAMNNYLKSIQSKKSKQ